MSERPGSENQDVETSETRYTRAEVDVMIGEVLAAKLTELGYTPTTQAQPPVSDKGKEPEVFDPLLKEQDASYHKEMLERVRPSKEVIDIPDGSEKGKASIEGELEFLKKEMKRIEAQSRIMNESGFELEEYVEDTSGRGPSERLHEPSKFDGDGDPVVHLNQYALISKLNRLPAGFMLEWFSTSLQGPALQWYHALEKSKKSSWRELSKAFLGQFSFNTVMNVGLRELENTTQGPNESFPDYLNRWRKKLILIRNKPDEQELIKIFINGTLTPFRNQMYCIPLRDVSEVYRMGVSIEDRLREEKKANLKSSPGNARAGYVTQAPRQGGMPGAMNPRVGQSVNVMRGGPERRFSNFTLPLSKVLERCIKKGLLRPLEPNPLPNPLPPSFNQQAYCEFHQARGHDTNNCKRLKHEVQDLIEQGKIPDPEQGQPSTRKNPLPNFSSGGVYVIGEYKSEEEILREIEKEEAWAVKSKAMNEVLVIEFWESDSEEEIDLTSGEASFSFKACFEFWDNEVPESSRQATEFWEGESKEKKVDVAEVDQDSPTLWENEKGKEGIRSLTRSGRVFKPSELSNKGKEKVGENQGDMNVREGIAVQEKTPANVNVESRNEPVVERPYDKRFDPKIPGGTDSEAVLKQLKRTKADVSVWDLIMASKDHREALLRALVNMRIPTEAAVEDLVAFIQRPQLEITFSDKDLPTEGRNHIKPLYIQAEVNGRKTRNVMVDDGSALNVCPLKLLSKFKIEKAELEPSDALIRAYDNTKRSVEGTFQAKVKVGPIESMVTVTVLDIPATFAMLLGRPWFHPLGGVPSTLHRKIKFPFEDKVVTVCAQEEWDIALVGEAEESFPLTGFQIAMLEFGNKGEQMMEKLGYSRGKGLGKYEQGMTDPLSIDQMVGKRAGLGYIGGRKALNDIQEPKAKEGLERKFFTPAAYDDFQVGNSTYPGLKVFMTVQQGQGSKASVEISDAMPNWEKLVQGFEDLLGIGVEDTQATPPELAKKEIEEALIRETKAEEVVTEEIAPEPKAIKEGEPTEEALVIPEPEVIKPEDRDVKDCIDQLFEDELSHDVFFPVNDNIVENNCNGLPLLFNDINMNFAYLCDLFHDDSLHFNDHSMHIFDIDASHHFEFNLSTVDNPRSVKIGLDLKTEVVEELKACLKKHEEAFAWGYEDMPGIDRSIAEHFIPTFLDQKPIKQKRRRIRPEWAEKIKAEISKQIEAGFLEVVHYPEC